MPCSSLCVVARGARRLRDGAADGGAGADTRAGAAARANVEPPPPPVNLHGFPPPYRQGYADGCATAPRHASARTRRASPRDGNYRTGWQDGRRAVQDEVTRSHRARARTR